MCKKGIVLAILIILIDQWSKFYIFSLLAEHQGTIELTSFFNLVTVYNTGVSFGMFSKAIYGEYILSAVSGIIIVILLFWLKNANNRLLAVSLSLIIGGAVGNLIDRIRIGAVADFLDIHLYGYHWPAFNVADSAICIGAFLLAIDAIRGEKTVRANTLE